MNPTHGSYLPNVKTKRWFANRSLSNCVRTEEQSRSWEDKFAFFFVCTKEIANLFSQPQLCSLVFAQFESGLLHHDLLLLSYLKWSPLFLRIRLKGDDMNCFLILTWTKRCPNVYTWNWRRKQLNYYDYDDMASNPANLTTPALEAIVADLERMLPQWYIWMRTSMVLFLTYWGSRMCSIGANST